MAKKRKLSTRAKASSVRVGRRKASTRVRSSRAAAQTAGRFVLPLLIICILLAALAFLGFSGYQTATASNFFELKIVEINGNDRTPAEDIRRLVVSAADKPGVWNADLADIRAKVEKFPFVRSAAVSRVLPAGIRINVTERVPAAVVHFSSGDFLVDDEAVLLAAATAKNNDLPFVLRGWDEAKTEKAATENLARLKLYKKMLDEWRQFDLSKRVKAVDLANLKEPSALIEDSGHPVSIHLAKDNLGNGLKTAIEAASGKGAKVKAVNVAGLYPILQYVE
jgi:cell division septal protein FtsQ